MEEISLVYITASGRQEAESLARLILSERLGACVNIYGGVQSLYLWKGDVEAQEETTLVVKTRTCLVPDLARIVKEAHSYDVPCVIAVPVSFTEPDYGRWISRETLPGATPNG